MLDASIDHLPPTLREQRPASLSAIDGVVVYPFRYGWILWVPDNPDEHAADFEEYPAEVLVVQMFARAHGCDFVMFDADADRISDLPSWAGIG
jgi:hypothetical protein